MTQHTEASNFGFEVGSRYASLKVGHTVGHNIVVHLSWRHSRRSGVCACVCVRCLGLKKEKKRTPSMCALESWVFIILLHTVWAPKSGSGEMRGEQRSENIGLRSVITRQSHTWFHVRWWRNFKEEAPIGHLHVNHGHEREVKAPECFTFPQRSACVAAAKKLGLIITAPRNDSQWLFCYLQG